MQRKFDEVDKLFDKLGEKHKKTLENTIIKPIHDEFQFAQNGLWTMIGTMSSGKTYNYLKLAAKQERMFDEPFFETVTVCSTSGEFDQTVSVFTEAIWKSNLNTVQDDKLLDYLNKYIKITKLYQALIRFTNSKFRKLDDDDDIIEIIATYNLDTKNKLIEFISKSLPEIGWKTYPHRMLFILDDFASHSCILFLMKWDVHQIFIFFVISGDVLMKIMKII